MRHLKLATRIEAKSIAEKHTEAKAMNDEKVKTKRKKSRSRRKSAPPRRSQAERRAASSKAVLESAIKLFGTQGYNDTSLEDIGSECGLTVRPIYHYFDSKENLFRAVSQQFEARLKTRLDKNQDKDNDKENPADSSLVSRLLSHLEAFEDPELRQVLLIDSPLVLGEQYWQDSALAKALSIENHSDGKSGAGKSVAKAAGTKFRETLINRLIIKTFVETAIALAEAGHSHEASTEAKQALEAIANALPLEDDSEQLSLFG